MIVGPRLPHPWNVGRCRVPHPWGAISPDRHEREALPARRAADLCEANSQRVRWAQDADITAGKDGATGGRLRRHCEPASQDRGHLRLLPAPGHGSRHPIHGDLHLQVRRARAQPQRSRDHLGRLHRALGLPGPQVRGRAVKDPLRTTGAAAHPRAPREERVGSPLRPFRCDRGRQLAHVIGESPGLRHTQGRLIWSDRRATAVAPKRPDGDGHLAQQGFRTHGPGVHRRAVASGQPRAPSWLRRC
jgi:hypothetical protein